jgi:hypothetical protein
MLQSLVSGRKNSLRQMDASYSLEIVLIKLP